jgi:hypothetical protein
VSRFLLSSAGLVSVLLALGCNDDEFGPIGPSGPSGPPAATGTLVFDWSIEGRQDAEACVEVGAVSFDAIIVDEGFVVRDLSVPCEDFEARVELYTDDFLARSSLLDEEQRPAVGRIIEDLFVIEEGRVTHLVMDYLGAPVPMDPVPDAGAPVPGVDGGSTVSPDAAAPDEETPPDAGPPPEDGPPDAGAADAAP